MLAATFTLGLANVVTGTSPALADTCSWQADDHCRAIVHWPVHAIHGIGGRIVPTYQCFTTPDPTATFVNAEMWIGPDNELSWIDAGDTRGVPFGSSVVHFWAVSVDGDYHEYQIPDGVPNYPRSFEIVRDPDGQWRVRMDGIVSGTPSFPYTAGTSADAGMESQAPGAHVEAELK
jgi:hypothetical protein